MTPGSGYDGGSFRTDPGLLKEGVIHDSERVKGGDAML